MGEAVAPREVENTTPFATASSAGSSKPQSAGSYFSLARRVKSAGL